MQGSDIDIMKRNRQLRREKRAMNLKTNPGDEDDEDDDANPGADLATTSDSRIPATSTPAPDAPDAD